MAVEIWPAGPLPVDKGTLASVVQEVGLKTRSPGVAASGCRFTSPVLRAQMTVTKRPWRVSVMVTRETDSAVLPPGGVDVVNGVVITETSTRKFPRRASPGERHGTHSIGAPLITSPITPAVAPGVGRQSPMYPCRRSEVSTCPRMTT
jgi:hypothetical protein